MWIKIPVVLNPVNCFVSNKKYFFILNREIILFVITKFWSKECIEKKYYNKVNFSYALQKITEFN